MRADAKYASRTRALARRCDLIALKYRVTDVSSIDPRRELTEVRMIVREDTRQLIAQR